MFGVKFLKEYLFVEWRKLRLEATIFFPLHHVVEEPHAFYVCHLGIICRKFIFRPRLCGLIVTLMDHLFWENPYAFFLHFVEYIKYIYYDMVLLTYLITSGNYLHRKMKTEYVVPSFRE